MGINISFPYGNRKLVNDRTIIRDRMIKLKITDIINSYFTLLSGNKINFDEIKSKFPDDK